MFSNDITANKHIEKIKKHQPICHKHQFPNSLPALEPLPMNVSPIANLNEFHHQLDDKSHDKVYAISLLRDKQMRMDKVWVVVSRIFTVPLIQPYRL